MSNQKPFRKTNRDQEASVPALVRLLRADRDCEKRLRKDAEAALEEASELIEEIMLGKVNPEDECEKWLRKFDVARLESCYQINALDQNFNAPSGGPGTEV